MSSQLTPNQNISIKAIAEAEAISDYDLEVNSTFIKGDGYLGIISNVNITSESKKLNLIIKTAEKSSELRKKVPVRKAYLREIYVYNTILPAFENFQKEYCLDDKFNAFAKIYGSSSVDCDEYLILENLKENGYKMWNRQFPMNPEHVELVFSEYGRFHAVSLAMRDKDPEKFYELTRDMEDIFMGSYTEEEFNYAIKVTLDNGFKAVKGDNSATEALQRFSDIATKFFFEELHVTEDSIVIIHGDSWCNNMMFKYEDSENAQKPTKMCLIDWQLSKVGSPLLDLTYFFFVCSSKDIIYDYKKYLKIYHKSVCKNLKKFSCNPEELFPYSLVEHHWKKYAKFGLYMAIMVIKLMLSEVDEVPILNEIVESGESLFDICNFQGVRLNDYNKRISDIIIFMAENKLI